MAECFKAPVLKTGRGESLSRGGIAAASADIARILFYIFVVIFMVLLILGLKGEGKQAYSTYAWRVHQAGGIPCATCTATNIG